MTDFIIVGSGVNGLVAASLLAMKGYRVTVLERNEVIGGCIRSEELAPGFIIDTMAATWVLFLLGPGFAALGPELEKRGFGLVHPEIPTGSLMASGKSILLTKDRKGNCDTFGSNDGQIYDRAMQEIGSNAPFLFALLGGELWSWKMARLVAREAWRRGPRGLMQFFGEALVSARSWLAGFSPDFQALLAPWVLHCGLGPESAYSGQMAKIIAFALEAAGAPLVKGGGGKAVEAFCKLITDHGGTIRTNADVSQVIVDASGRATGVTLATGETMTAAMGVACSVAPSQLYGRLLKNHGPTKLQEIEARDFQHGKGNMQIHYALSAPLTWKKPELAKVALLHLTSGLDAVSKAANEAERGMLPVEPTICLGQPSNFDTTRAPAGKATLWIQLPEAPRIIKGDAAGKITTPADGRWTEAVREAYADRVETILASHCAGFKKSIIKRRAISPADLEAMNINLVGGDPYGGFCGIDQFFLWRPFKSSVNHQTAVKNLFHIGASTHPGPGLGGGSGFLFASAFKPKSR